ncbi:hypothetical protein SAMN04515671_0390 [Nakamurella panacisegetis]|uniref:Membrane domain of glycerophosphoryl diester phosphodiesterase n=1 Tax=Nakamurella panacisegetis TaxID=1090615 RepID=A0A1H0I768_9ACTN|nr:hypothetical protein [Nakamurella panacisegetis]SDO27227.1 hypothetical protein SAMN04515671_0390 [Nakamurella panacisegetis]
MSLPPYSNPANSNLNAPQPGLYPLRPLQIGEIFGAAARVAWRHILVLAPIGLLIGVVSSAVEFAVMKANGSLEEFASGRLSTIDPQAGPAEIQAQISYLFSHLLPAVGAAGLVSLIAAPVLAAVATPFAALGATTAEAPNSAGLARLRGRLGPLTGVAVLCGLAVAVGSVLLVVPGIIAWLMLLPAGPVVAMEKSSVVDSMRRAAALSTGVKGRLFGIMCLAGLITGAIGFGAAAILGQLVSNSDPVVHLYLTQAIAVVVGALTLAWTASVTAMIYIDIRMRREGLAQALLASSQPSSFS